MDRPLIPDWIVRALAIGLSACALLLVVRFCG